MGFVPPPRALTEEEWLKDGKRDIEFEKWMRYSGPLGAVVYFLDLMRGTIINKEKINK